MDVPATSALRLVGCMPRNWPLWVPLAVQWMTTSLRSQMVSSVENLRSGKARRQVSMWVRRFCAPEVRVGNTGSWKRQLSATSSETTLSFPWFQHSSMKRWTICLLSTCLLSDCLFCEVMLDPPFCARNYRLLQGCECKRGRREKVVGESQLFRRCELGGFSYQRLWTGDSRVG